MSIFVNKDTKVIVQGITGSQGSFYAKRNRDYGTQVVGGVNPKKAGTDVDGIPVFASVAEAREKTGATVSMILGFLVRGTERSCLNMQRAGFASTGPEPSASRILHL